MIGYICKNTTYHRDYKMSTVKIFLHVVQMAKALHRKVRPIFLCNQKRASRGTHSRKSCIYAVMLLHIFNMAGLCDTI